MAERISFHDHITANKWKSNLIIFLVIGMIIFFGYLIGIFTIGAVSGVTIAVIIAIIFTLIGYYAGDSIILKTSGAKEVNVKTHAHLWHTVEGLSIAAGISMPKVYVINDTAINAFATGRDYKHASVTVTTGALEKLNRQELEGVIGHELSHIKNYDVRVMMLTTILVGVLVLLSDFMLRSFIFGNKDRENRVHPALIIVALALAILTPIIGELMKLAISRKREYLADANGALLTRYPEGLASALKKIRDDKEPLVEAANKATASLWIENPLRNRKAWLKGLFQTHPPIEERIKRLENM
ncbi:M48 family metallopeptidase [Candidatus Woesearchaeota archaeon]|nr:M48 family metallopeptidase [Candidatus Woesearchaeota archaeon]HIH25438.1 M48 family metallopeptidase [Nanoarchaeota archaeon]